MIKNSSHQIRLMNDSKIYLKNSLLSRKMSKNVKAEGTIDKNCARKLEKNIGVSGPSPSHTCIFFGRSAQTCLRLPALQHIIKPGVHSNPPQKAISYPARKLSQSLAYLNALFRSNAFPSVPFGGGQ